jgi:hypothetical protein
MRRHRDGRNRECARKRRKSDPHSVLPRHEACLVLTDILVTPVDPVQSVRSSPQQ